MKNWKSFVSALLAGIMILSCATGLLAANVTFTDVSGHWAWTGGQIPYLVGKNVLNGYKQANGTYKFQPEGVVTRAEFIKMLDETFGLTATTAINYSDVKTSDWFYPYIAKAAAQGYLLNYGSSISPNGSLTREEATTLLVRYLDLLDAEKAPSSTFTDYDSISYNFKNAVLVAVQAGLITGYEENNGTYTFRPKNTLTRAEALTILYRAAGAIYQASASTKDKGSADTNVTITKGGVALTDMTLRGRVIITEGASGDTIVLNGCIVPDTLYIRGNTNIYLDDCTINNIVLDSKATDIRISMSNGTVVTNFTADSTAAMTLTTGTKVKNLTVNPDASYITVTGNGAIENVTIYATGFSSTMMPKNYNVAKDIYASFNSKYYTGSSDDVPAFSSVPYMSISDNLYYLNVTPDHTGRIYYYFTNQGYEISSMEFSNAYTNANYKGSFYATAGKNYIEKTQSTNFVDGYAYVVIMLSTENKDYTPILINNTPASGTGFVQEPYYDGNDIIFTPEVDGTVTYFYSDVSEPFSIASFEKAYSNTDNALKGTVSAIANRAGTISLSDRYLDNYPYVVLVLQNEGERYYQPVMVAAGDNGFTTEPAISTLGTIEFVANVKGTLYYYYSDSDEVPMPSDYNTMWKSADRSALADSASIVKGAVGSILYDINKSARYPYLILCVKGDSGNYFTPVVVKIDIDTGFSVAPYFTSSTEISFKGEQAGIVYWFFTNSSTLPSMKDFISIWNSTASGRRGSVTCQYAANYYNFTFNADHVNNYPYIAIMMVDMEDNLYQPVLVNVKQSTDTGFSTAPSCNAGNSLVYYKTDESGTVYYYLSRSSTPHNDTVSEFWTRYDGTPTTLRGSVPATGGSLGYIDFSSVDTTNYPGVVLMFNDNENNEHYPVYVSLLEGDASYDSVGITLKRVTDSAVTVASTVNGTIYYMFSNDTTRPSAAMIINYSDGTVSITANGTANIATNNDYKYMYIYMPGYDVLCAELAKDYVAEDGSTLAGNGLYSYGVDKETSSFWCIPRVDGEVTISISSMPNSEKTQPVTKNGINNIPLGVELDAILNNPLSSMVKFTLTIQLKNASGGIYEKVTIALN